MERGRNHGPDNSRVWRRPKTGNERGLREGLEQSRVGSESQVSKAREQITKAIEQFNWSVIRISRGQSQRWCSWHGDCTEKYYIGSPDGSRWLLTGAVHVSAGKTGCRFADSASSNPADVRQWSNSFAQWNTTAAPEICRRSWGCNRAKCTLETELGSTHLSLDTQLKEIEQGFMDLLEQRPRVR